MAYKTKEQQAAYMRKYRLLNSDKTKAYTNKYYQLNSSSRLASARKFREKNKDRLSVLKKREHRKDPRQSMFYTARARAKNKVYLSL